MKKIIFLLLLSVVSINVAYSQVVAGSTYSGLIISNPTINFSVTAIFANSSRQLDLNCDGVADMSVELSKGPTAIDGPNTAYLHILNPIFMVCADTGTVQPRKTHYFNNGDPLVCPGNTNWYNDATMQLGNYGCMVCTGPFSISDLFLAYKNNMTSQIGWIKISFNLIDAGSGTAPITLSVPQILSPCTVTSMSPNVGSGTATCGAFTYSYVIQQPYCNNQCSGSIAISNLTGGTPNYNYFWSPGVTTPTVNGLCSGIYSLTITDASSNTCTATFSVPNPAPMTFTLNTTNVSSSAAADGSICCTNLQGGSAPFLYNWLPMGGNSTCAYNLVSGTYVFCVTDQNGCQVCESATVADPTPITFSLSAMSVSCFAANNGSICCNSLSGGTAPYNFTWLPSGSTGSCANNLPAGTYTLCVTDQYGSQTCQSATVAQPPPITFSLSATNVSCFGGNNGSICCTALTGGTPGNVYSWVPNISSGSCANNLTSGNYTLCVTDSKGCQVCSTKVVTEPPLIQVNEVITQASCSSCCDGNLQLQIIGGTAPYTTTYSPTASSCAGTYSYCVIDANSCIYCDMATISYPTSIMAMDFEDALSVLPNPNNGTFEIKNLNAEISSIKLRVTDVSGKDVCDKTVDVKNQSVQINLDFDNGIYFLHITNVSSNKCIVKKIIVQK